MNMNPSKGTQVKTGDKFGIIGYWINKDQTHPIPITYVPDPSDIVPGANDRLIYIYFGKTKPNPAEINFLIKKSPPFP